MALFFNSVLDAYEERDFVEIVARADGDTATCRYYNDRREYEGYGKRF